MSEAVREAPRKKRPEFRNIHVTELGNYRMTVGATVSILHRISGFIMFAALPVILYLLQQSLLSEDTFAHFAAIMRNPLSKIVLLGVLWAYYHHFCAGVRHLFMDLHMAIEKDSSRKTAGSVLVISLLLTFITALKLFGVF